MSVVIDSRSSSGFAKTGSGKEFDDGNKACCVYRKYSQGLKTPKRKSLLADNGSGLRAPSRAPEGEPELEAIPPIGTGQTQSCVAGYEKSSPCNEDPSSCCRLASADHKEG